MTDKRPAPAFAMIGELEFKRLRAPDQIEMVKQAQIEFPEIGPGHGKNPSARWQQIRQARELFYSSRRANHPEKHPAPAASGLLSAAEVNEWLGTLPPPRLAGL